MMFYRAVIVSSGRVEFFNATSDLYAKAHVLAAVAPVHRADIQLDRQSRAGEWRPVAYKVWSINRWFMFPREDRMPNGPRTVEEFILLYTKGVQITTGGRKYVESHGGNPPPDPPGTAEAVLARLMASAPRSDNADADADLGRAWVKTPDYDKVVIARQAAHDAERKELRATRQAERSANPIKRVGAPHPPTPEQRALADARAAERQAERAANPDPAYEARLAATAERQARLRAAKRAAVAARRRERSGF